MIDARGHRLDGTNVFTAGPGTAGLPTMSGYRQLFMVRSLLNGAYSLGTTPTTRDLWAILGNGRWCVGCIFRRGITLEPPCFLYCRLPAHDLGQRHSVELIRTLDGNPRGDTDAILAALNRVFK